MTFSAVPLQTVRLHGQTEWPDIHLSTASELGNVGRSSRYRQSSISQLDKVLLHMACNLVQGREGCTQGSEFNFFTGCTM